MKNSPIFPFEIGKLFCFAFHCCLKCNKNFIGFSEQTVGQCKRSIRTVPIVIFFDLDLREEGQRGKKSWTRIKLELLNHSETLVVRVRWRLKASNGIEKKADRAHDHKGRHGEYISIYESIMTSFLLLSIISVIMALAARLRNFLFTHCRHERSQEWIYFKHSGWHEERKSFSLKKHELIK